MTRLINTGFETGDILDTSSNDSATASTAYSYTGGYSILLPNNAVRYAKFSLLTPGDVFYGSFFVYYTVANTANRYFLVFMDTDNSLLLEIGCTIDQKARLSRNGTELAVSTNAVLSAATWHHIEFYVYIADSGGRGVMKVDGTTVIDYTGDTKPSTNTNVYSVEFRGAATTFTYYDDFILNDDGGSSPDNTYPGKVRLFPLRPTGAGNYTQWDRGGTDSGANWSQVEEVPASSSDYVYTTVDDEIDSYALGNLSGIPGGATYKSVIVVAEALVDSGSKKLALGVRSGSTDSFGSDKTIGVSYLPYYERFTTDPADSNSWTESDINALEIAIKSRA